MPTVRNPRGLRDYGTLGKDHKAISNAVLRHAKGPVRPSVAKAPLQPRKLPDVRKTLPGLQMMFQQIKAGKRNGPKVS